MFLYSSYSQLLLGVIWLYNFVKPCGLAKAFRNKLTVMPTRNLKKKKIFPQLQFFEHNPLADFIMENTVVPAFSKKNKIHRDKKKTTPWIPGCHVTSKSLADPRPSSPGRDMFFPHGNLFNASQFFARGLPFWGLVALCIFFGPRGLPDFWNEVLFKCVFIFYLHVKWQVTLGTFPYWS